MKYNTLRHYLKTIDDLPEGQLEAGNKKTFSLEEIHEIQQKLFDAGKIPVDLWPGKSEGDKTAKLLIYNLKGGVSKTSTTANLAQFLAARGFKVLILDLDPQASCSDLFDIQADIDGLPSIYDVIKYDGSDFAEQADAEPRVAITDAVQATYFPNIDMIPGSLNLTEFEYETAQAAQRGVPFYSRVADSLQTIEDAYDIILFDTPPHMSFAVIATLYAANSMLIPLTAGMLDVVSLVKFLELAANTLDQIEGEDKDDAQRYDFIRLILTRYSPGDSAELQLASFLRNTLGEAMMGTDFLKSTAIADAGNTMNPLLEVEPSSFTRKTYDRIFESLHGIALEIEQEVMRTRSVNLKDEVAA
jgi:chromosome partitioning protein